MSEIIYESVCDRCEVHKTERSILESIKNTIEEIFRETLGYTASDRVTMIKTWFEQYKLDERTKLIQGYKKSNIKEIRK